MATDEILRGGHGDFWKAHPRLRFVAIHTLLAGLALLATHIGYLAFPGGDPPGKRGMLEQIFIGRHGAIVAFISFFVLFEFIRHLILIRPSDELCAAAGGVDLKTAAPQVARMLRERAYEASMRAWAAIFLMLVALIGGILIFLYAENIQEKSKSENIQEQSQSPASAGESQREVPGGDPAQVRGETESSRGSGGTDAMPTDGTLSGAEIFDRGATLAIRIGAVAIIVFLVKILLNVYQYNQRVSEFYLSRLDAVLLTSNIDTVSLSDVADLFEPKVNVGKAPKSPVDQAVELAKVITELGVQVGARTHGNVELPRVHLPNGQRP